MELSKLSDLFGRYFLVVGCLPALVFLGLAGALIVPGLPPGWQVRAGALASNGWIAEFTLLGLAALVLAALLVSLGSYILRLYEGRRDLPKKGRRSKAAVRHAALAALIAEETKKLEGNPDVFAAAAVNALLEQMRRLGSGVLLFETTSLHTTRLGTVLAVLDEYPQRRYGISFGVIWPRLRSVLPKEFVERVDSQNISFMFLLNLSACCLLFALLWGLCGAGALLGWFRVGLPAWAGVLVAALLGAYLFYRVSIPEALGLTAVLSSAIDLYRTTLLRQFGLHTPASFEEEVETWRKLGAFILLGEQKLRPPFDQPGT